MVYEDPNGGSPIDATLNNQFQISIKDRGIISFEPPSPIIVNSNIIWIGMYMPPGMEFLADNRGNKILTYWAWTPESLINLRDLSSAQILGPSDGTSPVNLDIGGVARITATARSTDEITDAGVSNLEGVIEINDGASLEVFRYLKNYDGCPSLFYDIGDIIQSNHIIGPTCRETDSWNAPRSPAGLIRRSNFRNSVYDITFFNDSGNVYTGTIPTAVTHCVAPAITELKEATLGIAYESPRRWYLLPSATFRNLACAEISRGGSLSYFTQN